MDGRDPRPVLAEGFSSAHLCELAGRRREGQGVPPVCQGLLESASPNTLLYVNGWVPPAGLCSFMETRWHRRLLRPTVSFQISFNFFFFDQIDNLVNEMVIPWFIKTETKEACVSGSY